MDTKPKKKVTYYSGAGGYKNVTIELYMQGIYFNPSTKCKEKINTKPNKYNATLIKQINELNGIFQGIILVYGVTVIMIQEHKDHSYGDSKNLFRLMSAQSGTIKYNKVLRRALRTYSVDKQKIYDELKDSLKRQYERAGRNKQLILDMFKDYGMHNLTDLVLKDTGLDIFEHAQKFFSDKQLESVFMSDDDLEKFYTQTKIEYAEWLKNLAAKYNVNIYDEISQSVIKHREQRRAIVDKAKQERKEKKETDKRNRVIDSITKDGANIQSDLDRSSDLIENQIKGVKLGYLQVKRLRTKLDNYEDSVYYIGVSSNGGVKYLSEDMQLHSSILAAEIFKNKENAVSKINKALENEENEGLCMLPIKLVVGKKIDLDKLKYTGNIVTNIQSNIEITDELSSRYLALNVIYGANGILSTMGSGTAIVYIEDKHKSKVLCYNKNGECVPGGIFDNIIVDNVSNKKQPIRVGNEVYRAVEIKFNCGWYNDIINKVNAEQQYIQAILNNAINMDTGHKLFGLNGWEANLDKYKPYVIDRLRSRLKSTLTDNVYYITAISVNERYVSTRDIVYIRLKNSNKMCKTMSTVDLFDDYQKAVNAVKIMLRTHKDYVYNIEILNRTYLE